MEEFVSSYQLEFQNYTNSWNIPVYTIAIIFAISWIVLCFFITNIPEKICTVFYKIKEKSFIVVVFVSVLIFYSVLNYIINDGRSSWLDALQHEYASKLFATGHFWEPYTEQLSLMGRMGFLIVHDGKLFIKYFPGWAIILSLFRIIHPMLVVVAPALMLAVVMTVILRFGTHFFDRKIAFFAAAFAAVTPYTLASARGLTDYYPMLASAACVGGFFIYGLLFHENEKKSYLVFSLCFYGLGVLVRPYDMVLALPSLIIASFIIYGRFAWLAFLKNSYVLIPFCLFWFYYIYELTGSFSKNPYALYSTKDKLGFGVRYFGPYHFNDAVLKYKNLFKQMVSSKALFSPYYLTLIIFSLLPGKFCRASWAVFSLFIFSAAGYFFYYGTHLHHMFAAVIYLTLLVIVGLSRIIEFSCKLLGKISNRINDNNAILASFVLIAFLLSISKFPLFWGRSHLFNAPYISVERAGIKNSIILFHEMPNIGHHGKPKQLRSWHPKNEPFAIQKNGNLYGWYKKDKMQDVIETFSNKDIYFYIFNNEFHSDKLILFKEAD